MTVAELIEFLSKEDQESVVWCRDGYGDPSPASMAVKLVLQETPIGGRKYETFVQTTETGEPMRAVGII